MTSPLFDSDTVILPRKFPKKYKFRRDLTPYQCFHSPLSETAEVRFSSFRLDVALRREAVTGLSARSAARGGDVASLSRWAALVAISICVLRSNRKGVTFSERK